MSSMLVYLLCFVFAAIVTLRQKNTGRTVRVDESDANSASRMRILKSAGYVEVRDQSSFGGGTTTRAPSRAKLTLEQLNEMEYGDLQAACKEADLSAKGKKEDLVDRLAQHLGLENGGEEIEPPKRAETYDEITGYTDEALDAALEAETLSTEGERADKEARLAEHLGLERGE